MITLAEARAWIEAYGAAWMARDPAQIVELFTAEASYRERRFRRPIKSRQAIRDYWQVLVREQQRDVVFKAEQIMVDGDQAFVHWTSQFLWRPINGIMELDAVARVTFGDERNAAGLRPASAFEEWIENRDG